MLSRAKLLEMIKQVRDEKRNGKRQDENSGKAPVEKKTSIVNRSNYTCIAIRCCSIAEAELWSVSPNFTRSIRQGAGYEIDRNLSLNILKQRIANSIRFAYRLGSREVLILRNAPRAMAEHYFEGQHQTLNKINSVINGNSRMVSRIVIDNGDIESTVDLIIAVLGNYEIMTS